MRGLELYDLGDDGVVVNVTDVDDLSEVTNELAEQWTWDTLTGPTLIDGEDGEVTEWLTLIGAKRKRTTDPLVEIDLAVA